MMDVDANSAWTCKTCGATFEAEEEYQDHVDTAHQGAAATEEAAPETPEEAGDMEEEG